MKKISKIFDGRHIVAYLYMLTALLFCIHFTVPTAVYSPDSPVIATEDGATIGGSSNWVSAGESIATDIKVGIVTILTAVAPIAFLIALGLLMFTKDERKITSLLKWMAIIFIVIVLILLVNKGLVMEIIRDFATKISG